MDRNEAIEIFRWWQMGIITNEKQREAIETLIPELAESEDERIRKEIISALKYANDGGVYDKHIAYLEKHKEQKYATDDKQKWLDGIKRDWFERGKKEVLTVPELYGLEKQKGPENISASTMAPSCWTEEPSLQKEQKDVRVRYKTRKQCYLEGLEAGRKEQKPAQTDDEREYVKTLKGLVSDFIRDNCGSIADVGYYQRIYDWLDGRHIEQMPAEWSEEDEDYMGAIISIINRETALYPKGGATEDLNNDLINWLKSLRSLRPSWKPSEEQMEALNQLLCHGDFSYIGQATKLQELYIDLKKLM